MRRRVLSVSLVIGFLAALAWAGPAGAEDGTAQFQTRMTGRQEVPGPGDPDGVGHAFIEIGPGNLICYKLVVHNVDMPTAAHIHIGVRHEAGPIVVPNGGVSLPGTWVATSSGAFVLKDCVTDSDAPTIRSAPEGFYVNVHNMAFPGGALRGQLP